jgi:hypothetical protein
MLTPQFTALSLYVVEHGCLLQALPSAMADYLTAGDSSRMRYLQCWQETGRWAMQLAGGAE